MLQILHNHSFSHQTDLQHSSISFPWFWLICCNISIVRLQRLHDLDKSFGNIFHIFVPGVQSNKEPYRVKHDRYLSSFYHTQYVLKLFAILLSYITTKIMAKPLTFSILFLLLWLTTNKLQQMGLSNIAAPMIYNSHQSILHLSFATVTVIWGLKNKFICTMFNQLKACNCIQVTRQKVLDGIWVINSVDFIIMVIYDRVILTYTFLRIHT